MAFEVTYDWDPFEAVMLFVRQFPGADTDKRVELPGMRKRLKVVLPAQWTAQQRTEFLTRHGVIRIVRERIVP